MDFDQIWWTHINGASLFVQRIVDTLLQNRSAILCLSEFSPWYDTMYSLVEQKVHARESVRSIKYKEERLIREREPGKYLFENCCGEDSKIMFRPAQGYAAFLVENTDTDLHQKYLWLKITDRKQARKWINFVIEYQKRLGDREGGVFLLEVYDESVVPNGSGLEILSFDREIGEYDRFTFNMLAASNSRVQGDLMKQYLAELVSTTVGNDIELSAECMQYGDRFLNDPLGIIQAIVRTKRRSNGTEFKFSQTEDYIDQCIWIAQIKLAFPLMEKFRRKFINRHRFEIENPDEADIGWLYGNSTRLSTTAVERDRLAMYRSARNSLAHMSSLRLDDLRNLFAHSE